MKEKHQFILNNKNLGFSKAANIGLNSIKSDDVLIFNFFAFNLKSYSYNLENEIFKKNPDKLFQIADDLIDFKGDLNLINFLKTIIF